MGEVRCPKYVHHGLSVPCVKNTHEFYIGAFPGMSVPGMLDHPGTWAGQFMYQPLENYLLLILQ